MKRKKKKISLSDSLLTDDQTLTYSYCDYFQLFLISFSYLPFFLHTKWHGVGQERKTSKCARAYRHSLYLIPYNTTQSRVLTTLRKDALEYIVGKVENTCYQRGYLAEGTYIVNRPYILYQINFQILGFKQIFFPLTHYQMTNFRLFQTERVCRRQFQI